MEKLQLQAQERALGSSVDALRKQGLVPAELYGHGIANMHISVSQGEFEKLLRKAGESTLVELTTADGKKHNVLIHDVQHHYLKSTPVHVDFYEVSMTEKLTATVALEFIGESQAVKAQGGTLVKVLSEVEVECLPTDLPHNLTVDISGLNTFDDTISVSNIPIPKGVTIVTPGDELVVKVQPPRDIEAELAQPVVEDVSAVGTVEKEKKEEEEPATEAAQS